MDKYTQLSLQERVAIFDGLKKLYSRGKIASLIGRATSTISREIRRNSDGKGYYYYPPEAQARSQKRKARHGFKVDRIDGLKAYIIEKLKKYWSPIAIAGRWSLEHPAKKITKEAIYSWIYGPEGKALGLPKLLPRAKPKRGMVRAKKNKSHIPNRVALDSRPDSANERSELGHLEGDLVFHKGSQSSNILTVVDRKSRMVVLVKNGSKKTNVVMKSVEEGARVLKAKTVTFDNGSEFTEHKKLTDLHGIKTYFCRPGAPWEKGTVENTNKMIRRFLPFNLQAASITQEVVDEVAAILNNTPRKILGFRTPREVHEGINPTREIRRSRVKLAAPAMEAFNVYNLKKINVALRC